MPCRIFLQTFPHLKVVSLTTVSMVPSPRLVFPQVLEYLLQDDINPGLKSLWNANQNANQINGTAIFYCRKLFMYFIRQCPLLHKWLYAILGRRQRAYGLERYGQDNPSCPSGRQSHEATWLSEACQSMSGFLDLCCYSSFFPDQKWNSLLVEWTFCLIIQRILESVACLSRQEFSPAGDMLDS